MSITHRLSVSVGKITDAFAGGDAVSGTSNEVGSAEIEVRQDFAIVSNQSFAIAFTVASLQSVVLIADVDLTIKTNSSGSPANTINLKAGRPYVWRKSDGYNACLFTVDVTAWYVTTTAAARLRGKILTG